MGNQLTISSDDRIENIDCNFKVVAGPGAGKTYWLIEHIKNVLYNSPKLTSTSKISCITYTTVGAEEILSRLGDLSEKVEVSTIHSFLYNNVVKPYVHLLQDDLGNMLVNVEEMDSHIENKATQGKIYNWQKQVGNSHSIRDKVKIKVCLENLDWFFENDDLILKPRKNFLRKVGRYWIREEDLPIYKQLYWAEGVIHHEDVLYFAFRIISDFPLVIDHLHAKYPYMFLDEFQDTNPIQTKIIKLIGNAGTIIGVIGDPAQSIYGFQGASRTDFLDFSLSNQQEYKIENNRRSGKHIVDILNYIRNGDSIVQSSIREESKISVYFIECSEDVSDTIAEFHNLRTELGLQKDYCILTRNNETVKMLHNTELTDVWQRVNDADEHRERLLKSMMIAYKLVGDNRNDLAIKEIIRSLKTNKTNVLKSPFRDNQFIDPLKRRSLSVDVLEYLIEEIEKSTNLPLIEFYNSLLDFLKLKGFELKKVSNGKFKRISEKTTVGELLDNTILPEEKSSEIRTIHKAKGAEFESVLLYFKRTDEMGNLFNPEIQAVENDDTRVLYVALSRAKDLLCIAVPPLKADEKQTLTKLNLVEWP